MTQASKRAVPALGLAVLAAVAAGCGRDIAQDIEPSPRWKTSGRFWPRDQLRFLFVVDDDPGPDATALRGWMRAVLRRSLEHTASSSVGQMAEDDPAAWWPFDWRAVVLSPTGDLGLAVTPVALETNRSTPSRSPRSPMGSPMR